jgi:hypothetical protein
VVEVADPTNLDPLAGAQPAAEQRTVIGRRAFLAAAGGLGLVALVPPGSLAQLAARPPGRGQAGRFLSAHELDTLRAVTARLVPGRPEDPDPGALEAGCAEAIDVLLGAFSVARPPIHTGGPFSGRAGGHHDDFADFVALDRLAELGWRIRIEGSQGRPEREFAGPVMGLQEIFRSGLAHLDTRARGAYQLDFVAIPGASQDALLSDTADADLQTFVAAALQHTLDAMYGAPEYGGNRRLVGWQPLGWAGDVQPRGFTTEQISQVGRGGRLTRAQADAFARQFPALAGNPAANSVPATPPSGAG